MFVCVQMLGFAAFTVKLVHTLRMIDQIFEFDISDAAKLQNIIMYYRKMVRQSNHIYHKFADRVSNLSPKYNSWLPFCAKIRDGGPRIQ